METQEQINQMNGTAGREEGFLVGNCYYSNAHREEVEAEIRQYNGPRVAKKLIASIRPAVATWTWRKQYSRSLQQYTCVQENYQIVEVA